MFNGKRIVVTGSSGFIGKKLISDLEKKGAKVIKIDLKRDMDLSKLEHAKKINKFDMVYHLAAKTYVPDSYSAPLPFYNNNILCTLNILELCRLYNAKMIYSSSYVYGQPKYLPIDEHHPICGYNPYSQTKIICEQICEGYNRDYNVPVTILRSSNCYGKGQNKNFLIPKIIFQAKKGKIQLRDPRPKRDFIYIDDLVTAFIKAGLNMDSNLDIFNIGYGKSYSVKEILKFVIDNFPNKIEVVFTETDRRIEVMDTVYNINKAKQKLDWIPKIGLKEGLKRIIFNYNKQETYLDKKLITKKTKDCG